MERLFDMASRLGVKVEYADLTGLDRDGDFCRRRRCIRLQIGMLARLERSVFAHELAHAYFDDERSMIPHLDDRMERRADEWAAHILIERESYTAAAERFGRNVEYIAQELGVMDFIVEAYERTLHRIGDAVYVNPRMGIGNWDARFEAVA